MKEFLLQYGESKSKVPQTPSTASGPPSSRRKANVEARLRVAGDNCMADRPILNALVRRQ